MLQHRRACGLDTEARADEALPPIGANQICRLKSRVTTIGVPYRRVDSVAVLVERNQFTAKAHIAAALLGGAGLMLLRRSSAGRDTGMAMPRWNAA